MFHVIEHPDTRSLAAIATRPAVFEAELDKRADSGKDRKRASPGFQDVRVRAGEPLMVTLAKPITVRIPRQ